MTRHRIKGPLTLPPRTFQRSLTMLARPASEPYGKVALAGRWRLIISGSKKKSSSG